MGAPILTFTLVEYEAPGECTHAVLLRVRRPGASNADEGAVDAAIDFADSVTAALRGWYERWQLRRECSREHAARILGASELPAVGEDLDEPGLRVVGVWVAEILLPGPWVVLGTATDEAAFWTVAGDDPDLDGLPLKRPARRVDAFFLTDEDGGHDLSHPR